MSDIVKVLGEGWVLTVLLLSVRIATVLLLTPVLYAAEMPATVRAAIVLGLACVIAMPFARPASVAVADVGALTESVLREAAVGAMLGLGILMAFGGFALAGRMVDVQIGYGIAQVFDPLTRTRAPVLSAVFGLFAAVFFFVADGHHALVRGIAFSVDRFPVGQAFPLAGAAEPLVAQMAALFTLGFALAAPVVLALLLVEFALGVVSRNLPQMNMLVMGIPVKVVVGLLALSVWATAFNAPAGRLYAGIAGTWNAWFTAGGTR
jgi:flagellar biosynthetic protein FliR